jgi:hypothetical protein
MKKNNKINHTDTQMKAFSKELNKTKNNLLVFFLPVCVLTESEKKTEETKKQKRRGAQKNRTPAEPRGQAGLTPGSQPKVMMATAILDYSCLAADFKRIHDGNQRFDREAKKKREMNCETNHSTLAIPIEFFFFN